MADRDTRRRARQKAGVPAPAPLTYQEYQRAGDEDEIAVEQGLLAQTDLPVTGDERLPPKESATQAMPRDSTPVTPETDRWETTDLAQAQGLEEDDRYQRLTTGAPDRNQGKLRLNAGTWEDMYLDPRTPMRGGRDNVDQTLEEFLAQQGQSLGTTERTMIGAGKLAPPSPEERMAQASLEARAPQVAERPQTARTDPWTELTKTPTEVPAPHVQFNPFEARNRAADLYGEPDPRDRSTRWEEVFLNGRGRRTDEQIDRESMVRGILGGDQNALEWRKQRLGEREAFDKGHYEAVEHDLADRTRDSRVSPGLAQAIAASGLVRPEDAIKLRVNDPIVKAFMNGGYQFGSGIKRAETSAYMDELGLRLKAQEGERNRQNTLDQARVKAEAAQAVVTPETRRDVLAANVDVDPGIAARFLAGTLQEGEVTPQQLSQLRRVDGLLSQVKTQSALESIISSGIKGEGSQTDTTRGTIIRQRANPKTREARKTELTKEALSVGTAIRGWNEMSDAGKQAMITLASNGNITGIARSALMPPEDRPHAARAQVFLNFVLAVMSGKAVTGPEGERIMLGAGMTAEGWNPFHDPSEFEMFMNDYAQQVRLARDNFVQEFHGWDAPEVQ